MSNSDKTQQNNAITETAGEPFPSQRIWRNKILTTITKSTMKVPMFSRGNAQSTRTQHITTNKENYPTVKVEAADGGTAGARRWMRLWVDVSPQGEVYLVKTGHLLYTLNAAVQPHNRTFRRNRS